MKKPDFSKQAMSKFFLHHTEKLILGLCLVGFGVFFWMGWKKAPFSEATPTELSQMGDRAEQYITADRWDDIKEYRVGNSSVLEDIEKAENEGKVVASKYTTDLLSGIAAKTLDARKDPEIFAPKDLQAKWFKKPILITMNTRFTDPYTELSPVSVPDAGGLGGGPGMGGGPGGFGGGLGGGEDDEDEMEGDDEEDEGDDEFGGASGGRGGLGGPGGFGGDTEETEEEDKPVVDAGVQVTVANAHTWPGLRPIKFGIPSATTKPWLLDIVSVTAVVDFGQQQKSYNSIFPGAIGYYPDRDKPIYQQVEVQRRVVGTDKWVDRTDWVQFGLPSKYPAMHRMPKAFHSTAPDITHPDHYDPVLTGPIPPLAMFDYRPYVSHPALAGVTRTFPELKEEKFEEEDAETIFGGNSDKEEPGLGGGQSGGLGGPGMGGGLGGPGMGGGISGGRGGGLGGPGLGGGMGMSGGLGGSRGGGAGIGADGEEIEQTRKGSDFTDYLKALDAKKPGSEHKLVRFFDVDPQAFSKNPGAKYEYRVRVWLGDPNNEDPSMEFVNSQGGAAAAGGLGGGRGPGMGGMGPGGMPGADDEEDYEDEEEEGGDGDGGEEESVFTKIAISSTMKVPAVRQRLNRATAEVDEKTKNMVYTIAEPRKRKVKNEEGVEEEVIEYETIKIPKNRAYLRFARPSEWSEPTEVTIGSEDSMVAGGKVVPPRVAKMKVGPNDVAFPLGEPAAEMVASQWSDVYGTAVPTKQTVYRGDLMNYFTAAHIVNPINWRVYLTKNESDQAEKEDKYRVPIRTQKVFVDTMGGGELPLPRAEKMRHDRVSEFLVMDADGNFKVHNDMEDRTTYRNLLLLPDEVQSVGKARRQKKKDEQPGGNRGGFGGGLGGFDDQ